MRVPIYQTPTDLLVQGGIARRIERARHVNLVRLGDLGVADYLVCRDGGALAILELKRRTCHFGGFPDYRIDLSKIERLQQLSRLLGLPAYLVVSFRGTLYRVGVNRPYAIGELNRRDKKDHSGTGHAVAAIFHWAWFDHIEDRGQIESVDELLDCAPDGEDNP